MSANTRDTAQSAVRHAERAADAWQAALAAQRTAVPDHAAFYALAAEVVATLRHLDGLCELLTQQVAGYAHAVCEDGGVLCDDEQGHDPGERIGIASSWAAQTRRLIGQAERAGNRFWSEIGHIAIDYPDADHRDADQHDAGSAEGPDAGEVSR
jgi:myo-inositol catabolism protein IolC